ncbi:phage tail tube protein [Carnimonas bestiolae]|uniref:phage tail tube protein n=1 Tax=Carnimonas bestiolae TaxID=3402172 RepID=UPI003EDBF0FB
MSSGAQISTAWKREKDIGKTPDGDWNVLRRTSHGVKPSTNTNESAEINEDRMSSGSSLGTIDVNGDVGTLMRYGSLDEFLASALGNDWDGNKLVMGDKRITFSLAKTFKDIGVSGIARGCQVSQIQLSFPGDNDVTATTSFIGTGWEDRHGNSFIDSLKEADDNANFSFKDISNLKMNGETLAGSACVDNFNLTFNNNPQTQRCIGTGDEAVYAGAILLGTLAVTGQVTLAWSALSYDLWARWKDMSTVSFSFTLGNEYGSYDIELPAVQIAGDWPDAGKNDVVQVQLNLTAVRKSPVITRHPPKVAVTGVSLDNTKPSVKVGSTVRLKANVAPSDASDKSVTWKSDNTSVATVDGGGKVKGVKAGSAKVTATTKDGGKSATASVTVKS